MNQVRLTNFHIRNERKQNLLRKMYFHCHYLKVTLYLLFKSLFDLPCDWFQKSAIVAQTETIPKTETSILENHTIFMHDQKTDTSKQYSTTNAIIYYSNFKVLYTLFFWLLSLSTIVCSDMLESFSASSS